jgi:hypothetical protein
MAWIERAERYLDHWGTVVFAYAMSARHGAGLNDPGATRDTSLPKPPPREARCADLTPSSAGTSHAAEKNQPLHPGMCDEHGTLSTGTTSAS